MSHWLFAVLIIFQSAANAQVSADDINALLKNLTMAGQGLVKITNNDKVVISENFNCSLIQRSKNSISMAGSFYVDGFWNIDLGTDFQTGTNKAEGEAFGLCDDPKDLTELKTQADISADKLEMYREYKCKDVKVVKTATCQF
jgi:hypothetical protein